jgi:hypothetical protein
MRQKRKNSKITDAKNLTELFNALDEMGAITGPRGKKYAPRILENNIKGLIMAVAEVVHRGGIITRFGNNGKVTNYIRAIPNVSGLRTCVIKLISVVIANDINNRLNGHHRKSGPRRRQAVA